jgi:hypothetical protein
MDILLQVHIIVVKNREMVSLDMILIASSIENGSSYIETSSIDEENNLKLRTSPHLPAKVLRDFREDKSLEEMESIDDESDDGPGGQGIKRMAQLTALCNPNGVYVLRKPEYKRATNIDDPGEDGECGGSPEKASGCFTEINGQRRQNQHRYHIFQPSLLNHPILTSSNISFPTKLER